jgi:hypothetical protein
MDLDALAITVHDLKARTAADIDGLNKIVLDLQAAVNELKNKIKSLDAEPKQVELPPRAPIGQDVFTTSEVEPHHEEAVHESPHHHVMHRKTHKKKT